MPPNRSQQDPRQPFRLDFLWSARNEPDPCEEMEDAEPAFRAIYRFLSRRGGDMMMVIGPWRIHLQASPDLATAYPELPAVLRSLGRGEPAMLDFPEQGTELTLALRPEEGDVLGVEMAGAWLEPNCARVGQRVYVSRRRFIAEWRRVQRAVRDELANIDAEGASGIDARQSSPPPREDETHELDRRLNRVAQGIDPVAQLTSAFDLLGESEQRAVVRRTVLLALQAGAGAEDAPAAILASGVKPRRTAAVLLTKGRLDAQLGKIADLPAAELRDGLLLSMSLLAIADGPRRVTRCAGGCSHWWHGALGDNGT